METIGSRIRALRKQHQVSQITLAQMTNVSRSNISKIESNEIKPTSNSIVAIADYFQVSTDWLLKGAEYEVSVAEDSALYSANKPDIREAIALLTRLEQERLNRVVEFIRFELNQQDKK